LECRCQRQGQRWLYASHFAVAEGFADKAELLIANKADVNALENKGETPLHVALMSNEDVVNLLHQHGGHE
jgi:ankyrin repeat protein